MKTTFAHFEISADDMKRAKLMTNFTSIALLSLCFFLSSCTSHNSDSDGNQANFSFSGNWQGNGTDAEGNEFTFFAKVSHLGNDKYRVLILDKLDTLKKPIHIMDGKLKDNRFSYTSDQGLYEGGGTLSEDLFEGYYKGSVDGTYKMWRINEARLNEKSE